VAWGRASQGRWEVLGKLAIAVVEVQEMTGTAGGDRRVASHKAYSSSMWLDSRAVHRVNNPILDRAVLSASRSGCNKDMG
jgi:hypothetical protein